MVRTRLVPLVAGGLLLPGLLATAAPAAGTPTHQRAASVPASASESWATWVPGPAIPARGELTAVTAWPSANDLVAFGVDPTSDRTYAYGWDAHDQTGKAPHRVAVPDVGRVLDAEADWAVGEKGILRYVDGVWRAMPVVTAPGTRTRLTRVGVGSGEAWAVGVQTSVRDRAVRHSGRGVLQRWDGKAWRGVPIPTHLLGAQSELTALTVGADVLVFGVDHTRRGGQTVALRYAGTTWTKVAVPTRPGYVDHLTTASYNDVGGWTAPVGDPSDRRPVLYRMNPETGALTPTRVPAPARGEVSAVTLDYGVPVAVGNSAAGSPFALRSSFADDGYGPWTPESIKPSRGRVYATEGMIVGDLFAVGYQQVGTHRKPVVFEYLLK